MAREESSKDKRISRCRRGAEVGWRMKCIASAIRQQMPLWIHSVRDHNGTGSTPFLACVLGLRGSQNTQPVPFI